MNHTPPPPGPDPEPTDRDPRLAPPPVAAAAGGETRTGRHPTATGATGTDPRGAGAEAAVPDRIGRYPVLARIGQGGFGVVYRGRDEALGRDVAIKVPHPRRVSSP